ncbi:MAG: DUF357 domain-containing protein [Candidatus Aenigmatarchaeota archaeon]
MDKTSKTLRLETEKWLSKLERERSKMQIVSESKEVKQAVKNLDAYISDSRHFLGKGDFVRSFEAVVYAWGILETLERLGLLEKK